MLGIMDQYQKELLNIAALTPKTVKSYLRRIQAFCEYVDQELGIDPFRVKSIHIHNWLGYLKKKKVGQSDLIHYRASLNSFYIFLTKLDVIKKNPVSLIDPVRKVRSELNKPISTKSAYKLLAIIDQSSWMGKRNFLMISFMWAMGLRLSETTSLKVCDFDPNHAPPDRTGLLRVHGKGKKQRVLFIVNKLYDNLIEYLHHPKSPKKNSDVLFPTQKGTSVAPRTLHSITQNYARKARIKERVSPHVLRHSFATEMYNKKVPIEAIRVIMGHDKISETSVYIHVSDELQKHALDYLSIQRRNQWQ